MSRIDKVTFAVRAIAGTVYPGGTVTGVYVAAGGSIMPSGTGAGSAAFGVVCPGGTIAKGQPIAVLKRGEIVEFGGSAATVFYAGVAGALGTASANATKVGTTIEGDRLVLEM